ncbi:P-loop containing nucleoside triphosphate hydrolase protein [Mycena rebaudengoi]|nr:P-loop containing nucleoside triphosphate hydrolase protein [Mycena rebaudengoi]
MPRVTFSPSQAIQMTHSTDWVDRRGAPRTVPMKVLVLGFCRTGTASMRTALEILEYKDVHHMMVVFNNPLETAMWTEATDAKFFGKGKPYGRKEWDQLLGHCQAITDLPSLLFAEELVSAYPDAKVILTNRDPEEWWSSFNRTIITIWCSRRVRLAEWLDPQHLGRVMPLARRVSSALFECDDAVSVTRERAIARYVQHYDNVRHMVPKERLLEYRVGEGWERLCAFLGHDVPGVEFPRINDSKMLVGLIHAWSWKIHRRSAVQALPPLVVLAAIGFAIYQRIF